ncbi:Rab GTPase-activating protein 1-like [Durusdinium trenchii]|uniref:Rab GTPase-activating protein 1-like n=1 Tax=Durusdinium trenchii TaxID=1381693 RepID=A0ABP0RNV8_9DINO
MAADDPDAEGLWKNLLSEGVLQHFKDSMNEEKPSEFLHLVLKGVPESLRSEAGGVWSGSWAMVWRTLLRARAAEIDAQDFPPLSDVELDPKVSRQIELDLPRRLVTFPEIPHFDLPKQQKMEQILRSYAYHEPQIGYCQGMNYIAGVLLLVLGNVADAYQAFVVFMNGFGLAGFYLDDLPLMLAYSFASLRRMKDSLPQLHDHFCEVKYRFPQFPVAWFMSLFVTILPLPLVKCFWDAVVLKGGPALVVLCVMTLRALRPILMFLGEDDVSFFFDAIKKRLGATLDGCHTRERRSDGGSRREALGTTK